MSMFPGANAVVIRNEAGEPIGWDYPSDEPDFDPYDDVNNEERPVTCKCGVKLWADDEDLILEHHEVCPEPEWLRQHFIGVEFPEEDA